MRSTILIGLTSFLLVSAALSIDLVRYHERPLQGIDPLAPLTIKLALN